MATPLATTTVKPFSFLLTTCAALLLSLPACGDDGAPPPPDVDGGVVDSGLRDAGDDAAAVDAFICLDDDGDGHDAPPCGDDCDDADASRYPGATEVCDGDDEDCNDATLGTDGDADGFVSSACCNAADACGPDCDDTAVDVNPDATETCNGGVDDDCNGAADLGDGVCVPCGVGYAGFDGACTDVDECAAGAPCGVGAGAVCANTTGSYSCACPAGYLAPALGGTCVDVDECAASVCGPGLSSCVNSAGTYSCTCRAGYTVVGVGAPCVDIDECASPTTCAFAMGTGLAVGTCANLDGSYSCACPAGYSAPASGGTCSDINECALGTDDCEPTVATCTNTPSSYRCACPMGSGGSARGVGGCDGVRYTDLGNGTVRDHGPFTVDWQQGLSPGTLTQAEAAAYCGGLLLAGGGWRLPTVDELFSTTETIAPPTIDIVFFPSTGLNWLWTSSPDVFTPANAWFVGFNYGGSGTTPATERHYARCVR